MVLQIHILKTISMTKSVNMQFSYSSIWLKSSNFKVRMDIVMKEFLYCIRADQKEEITKGNMYWDAVAVLTSYRNMWPHLVNYRFSKKAKSFDTCKRSSAVILWNISRGHVSSNALIKTWKYQNTQVFKYRVQHCETVKRKLLYWYEHHSSQQIFMVG